MSHPSDPDTLRVPAFMRKGTLNKRTKKKLLLTALDRKKAGVKLQKARSIKNEAPRQPPLSRGTSAVFSSSLRRRWASCERPAVGGARSKAKDPRLGGVLSRSELTKKTTERRYDRPLRKQVLSAAPQVLDFEPPIIDESVIDAEIVAPTSMARAIKPRTQKLRREPLKNDVIRGNEEEPPACRQAGRRRTTQVRRQGDDEVDEVVRVFQRFPKKIGTVKHYYGKIDVAVIKLSASLDVGDCIRYETRDGPYEQIVESMEIDRMPVFRATRGKEIGMKVQCEPIAGSAVTKA